jgi:selenide,water dikinase
LEDGYLDTRINGFHTAVQPGLTPAHETKQAKRLTSFAHGGGCGCKVEPAELKRILKHIPTLEAHPNLIVGVENSDDAAVYQLSGDQALVFTNDFQTPIIDDPYIFGCAAAANALSDVYAMGGTPIMATAIAGFPIHEVNTEDLQNIMRGGIDICTSAGVPLAGGHTIENPQPIFGLAVVGTVHPKKIKTNSGSRPGDKIILTKPLGIGVLASALRIDMLNETEYQLFVKTITEMNTAGTWLGDIPEVHGLTDITGFGLAGHLVEMAEGARVRMIVDTDSVPIYPAAEKLARDGVFPGGAYRNMDAYNTRLSFGDDWDIDRQLVFTDPQTNGGLLLSVEPQAAEDILARLHEFGCAESTVIGEVAEDHGDWQGRVLFR